MDFFTELSLSPYQLWLILGGILLVCEVMGAAGYLLWSGISALIVGLLTWLTPINWQWQWVLFSILTVIISVAWWYWLKTHSSQQLSLKKSQQLNQPSHRFIGHRSTLEVAIINGYGRVKIADGSWRAKCAEDLPVGQQVEVINVEGNTLEVKAVR